MCSEGLQISGYHMACLLIKLSGVRIPSGSGKEEVRENLKKIKGLRTFLCAYGRPGMVSKCELLDSTANNSAAK